MMRTLLLATAAAAGLTALAAFGAAAAPVPGAAGLNVAAPQHVVQADWYWNHRHWRHRRYYHHHWHYWN